MSAPLAALRHALDIMPSPAPERPGLLIRDPLGFTDAVLIVPPPLVPLLRFFDGESTELDLKAELVRLTGELDVSGIQSQLVDALAANGFLEDERFDRLREEREREFREAPMREPSHAGPGGYPAERESLRQTLAGYLAADTAQPPGQCAGSLVGIAAPHVSPGGGFRCYAAAYAALGSEHAEKTFVVLGTSHYGAAERFGLTRKSYRTPFGDAAVDVPLVERLEREGGAAAVAEDYCHKSEHSVEFQVVFLQHLFGPAVKILPILVGPFAKSLLDGGLPEEDPGVERFLDVLAGLQAGEGQRLLWVLGIDMAHVGRRYGDRFAARADEGRMQEVSVGDQARIERALAGDASGFWQHVQRNRDELRWCGASPLYAFLRAVAPSGPGELLRYEQWNIDPASVVSFAGMRFSARA